MGNHSSTFETNQEHQKSNSSWKDNHSGSASSSILKTSKGFQIRKGATPDKTSSKSKLLRSKDLIYNEPPMTILKTAIKINKPSEE